MIGIALAYTIPDHIEIDMSVIGDLAIMILGVCALMWVARKLIKMFNRS